jgi:SecD/SecF fusion protein
MIGICTSLFTSIFITRLILERWLSKDKEIKFSTDMTRNFMKHANFDFIKFRKTAFVIAGALILVSAVSLCTLKLNLGIDFQGGRNYVIRFDQEVNDNQIRKALADIDIFQEANETPVVKTFGPSNQVKVTTKYMVDNDDAEVDATIQEAMFTALKSFYKGDVTYQEFSSDDASIGIMSSQKVGGTIADDVTRKAFWAVAFSLVIIFVYIAIRFRKWQYGVSSIIALAHDTIIVIGMYSLLYSVMPFSMEVDQSFIAAVLTIIGYSINNTVVIFDRVRENVTLYPKRTWYERINNGVNSTLMRSINTTGTTLVVLLAIFIFGGETIRGFVFALLIGIFAGTFSSLFIAPTMAHILFGGKQEDAKILEAADKKRK